MLQPANVAETDEEWDHAEDAEAAVDHPPVERDAADWASNQCERDDSGAGDYAKGQDSFVTDRVDERSDERYRDDEMSEGEPVSSIGHEGVAAVGLDDAVMDSPEPGLKCGFAGSGNCRYVGDAVQQRRLAFQREGGDATEDEADDEQRNPDAGPADEPDCGVFRDGGRSLKQL